jgi:rare lipoprotein A
MISGLRRSGVHRLVAIALVALTSSAPGHAGPLEESVTASSPAADKMLLAPVTERLLALQETVAELEDPVLRDRYETVGEGEASYYGFELAGNRTASGERFNPHAMTAAHRSLPLGTRLRVTNKANGKSVVVRVNDRGPFVRSRIIDVSLGAAREIGMQRAGKAQVKLEILRSIG